MKTLTINVPDDMQSEVAAWEDGVEYALNVRQTAMGEFDLVSTGEPAMAGEEEADAEMMTDKPKKKMPATVAILIGKK